MRYLCLGYLNDGVFDSLPEEKKKEVMRECEALCVPFRATGKVLGEAGLGTHGMARSIRPKNGRPKVTDGPFVETKELLGSYFIIDAADMDEAIEVASLHPAALMGEEYGFGIAVYPMVYDVVPVKA